MQQKGRGYMKKSIKNFLIAAAAATVAAGAAVGYAVTLNRLMEIALSRKAPRSTERGKKKLAGSDNLILLAKEACKAAGELENIQMQNVCITANDGVPLAGHWYCPKNPQRIIVAMHGWRSKWSQDFAAIAPFWIKRNCAVLFAEQRGQGGSGGEYMGFGLLERYDCAAWANWVSQKTGGQKPIYLCGISMGAATVLMAAADTLPKEICGIIADCGFTSPHAIWRHVAENNLKIPYGIYSAPARDLCRRKITVASDSYSTTEALSKTGVPVLLIHGTEDKFVPIEMTYQNYKACAAPKRLFVVPGAEHGMSYIVDKAGYEKAVTDFWLEFDK